MPRPCKNCGKPFEPADQHQQYHSDLCRELAANRRRRARRHCRDSGQAATCYCVSCGVTFSQDDAINHDEDDGCCWYIVDKTQRACVECGQSAPEGDIFCHDSCYVKFGNRLIPHDPKHPPTAEQITWSPWFDKVIEPLFLKIRNAP